MITLDMVLLLDPAERAPQQDRIEKHGSAPGKTIISQVHKTQNVEVEDGNEKWPTDGPQPCPLRKEKSPETLRFRGS